MFRQFLFISCLLLSPFCGIFGAIPRSNNNLNKINFYTKELKNYKKNNLYLKNEINKFETKLSSINIKYINILNVKSKEEREILKIKRDRQNLEHKIDQFHLDLTRLKLKFALDQSNQQENDAEDVFIDNFYNNKFIKFHKQKIILSKLFKKIRKKLNKKKRILARIEGRKKLFEELSFQWEANKKEKVEIFLKQKKLITNYFSKIKLIKSQEKNKKLVHLKFGWPLRKYVGIKFKKKGVTFSFDSKIDIINSKSGIVAHVGKLSNYGTIVIIKHKKLFKSIYLGNFIAQVKKGEKINLGDIIGMTFPKSGRELGKLYFEVRKKNKAQKTISLLTSKNRKI